MSSERKNRVENSIDNSIESSIDNAKENEKQYGEVKEISEYLRLDSKRYDFTLGGDE